MTKEEFLMEKFNAKASAYAENHKEFYRNPSTGRVDPFKIADNLYYVGDQYVCIHLIDTGDGLILLDSGYLGAAHLLVDSIWRAGFDPKNVKWIIHTHGHSDHFGASEEFRIMYGTKLAISRVDAEIMRSNPELLVNKKNFPFAEVPEFDYEIEDGEIFELGNVKIRFVLSPGHTDGVLSSFFDVTYNGKIYRAGMFGGAGTNAVTLPYIFRNKRNRDCDRQMLDTIEMLMNEKVEIHLGNHPGNNNTFGKLEEKIENGGNPFIAPDSWKNFFNTLHKRVETIIKNNEELENEINNLN